MRTETQQLRVANNKLKTKLAQLQATIVKLYTREEVEGLFSYSDDLCAICEVRRLQELAPTNAPKCICNSDEDNWEGFELIQKGAGCAKQTKKF